MLGVQRAHSPSELLVDRDLRVYSYSLHILSCLLSALRSECVSNSSPGCNRQGLSNARMNDNCVIQHYRARGWDANMKDCNEETQKEPPLSAPDFGRLPTVTAKTS